MPTFPDGPQPPPPRPILAVPNVTAHPSTASVQITVLPYDGPLLCGFNGSSKGLNETLVAAVTGDAVCRQQHPCLNGGECRPLLGHYYCDCRNGTTGRNCEKSEYLLLIFLALHCCCLQPAELIVCVTDVWMDVCRQTFFKSLLLLRFCPIRTKLGTRDLCANTQKLWNIFFEILLLKFWANFFKILNQQGSYLGRQALVKRLTLR